MKITYVPQNLKMKLLLADVLILLSLFIFSCEKGAQNSLLSDDSDDNAQNFSDGDFDETQGRLFNLSVAPNKKNALSCRLNFSTDKPLKTFVKYYSPNHAGYKISEESARSEHYFFLWGMRENQNYDIEIYDGEGGSKLLATAKFHSGFLPEGTPKISCGTYDAEKIAPGFTFFTFLNLEDNLNEYLNPLIVMTDNECQIVWYFEYFMAGFSLFGDLNYYKSTQTILAGIQKGLNMAEIPAEEAIEIDLEGNVLWKSPLLTNVFYDQQSWHHTYQKLQDDTLIFPRPHYVGSLVGDSIYNVDREYNTLWSWSYLDHFEPPACDSGEWCDWTHTNTVISDKENGFFYLNSRNLSQFYKIEIESGDIVWKFGKGGDFTMISDHPDPWFAFAHAPEFNSTKDRLLFFDNGSFERGYSRIIEYAIDEKRMTAEISFEFDGSEIDKSWFAMGLGDVDRLENGNILATIGYTDDMNYSGLFEITPDKEIVWELFLEKNEDYAMEAYNAEKFMPPLEILK